MLTRRQFWVQVALLWVFPVIPYVLVLVQELTSPAAAARLLGIGGPLLVALNRTIPRRWASSGTRPLPVDDELVSPAVQGAEPTSRMPRLVPLTTEASAATPGWRSSGKQQAWPIAPSYTAFVLRGHSGLSPRMFNILRLIVFYSFWAVGIPLDRWVW